MQTTKPLTNEPLESPEARRRAVEEAVAAAPVVDLHTHLFPPALGGLSLWGIDELLTYHYLISETLRFDDMAPEVFLEMPKPEQADRIWDALFVRNTPLSEATRGVVAVMSALGLDPAAPDLREARAFFADQDAEAYVDRVMKQAGVTDIVMTNDPFDPAEAALWEGGVALDPRFHTVIRMDPMLNDWTAAARVLRRRGYDTGMKLTRTTVAGARRFLEDCIARVNPRYMAVSLPDDFAFPEDSPRATLIRHVVLPVCQEHGLPFAMMIGVRRQVNPALKLAGDALGKANIQAVERICAEFPKNRFLVTMLSRENQHELVVAARKFANLMPFGCWWFLNNPSIIDEMTRERLEMLGTSFIPQHSDARVLDQLLYKWPHSRRVIGNVLADAYEGLARDGRTVSRAEIERDVARLFSGNARAWLGLNNDTHGKDGGGQ